MKIVDKFIKWLHNDPNCFSCGHNSLEAIDFRESCPVCKTYVETRFKNYQKLMERQEEEKFERYHK